MCLFYSGKMIYRIYFSLPGSPGGPLEPTLKRHKIIITYVVDDFQRGFCQRTPTS